MMGRQHKASFSVIFFFTIKMKLESEMSLARYNLMPTEILEDRAPRGPLPPGVVRPLPPPLRREPPAG